jgi:hypothetical protein
MGRGGITSVIIFGLLGFVSSWVIIAWETLSPGGKSIASNTMKTNIFFI